jgi:3-deoxy-D-manno-octulosonate 8-phosphate phosphatase KdsC-like HAD superfamily phosphatase
VNHVMTSLCKSASPCPLECDYVADRVCDGPLNVLKRHGTAICTSDQQNNVKHNEKCVTSTFTV